MPALTVPTIFTAVDKMSSVLSKMQGNVGKFATDTQKKYAAISRSAQAWSTNSRQIAVSAGLIGTALVGPLVLATKAAADFEEQMSNIGTITGKENLTTMGKGVLEVFKKVPVPLHDLTESLYKIRSAGIGAGQAMDILNKSAILGIAGRGTTVEGADALTSAINVFKDEGLSANKIASMLFETVKLGKTTITGMSESFGATANIVHSGGVQLKDFLAATAAMTVMGEPASQAMNQIRASIFTLEKPTTRMKFLFHSLGVKDVHELIGRFGNLGNAMTAIEERGKKLGVNMAQAWGKVGSYAAVIALTGARGKGAYNNNLLGMSNSEVDLAEAYNKKLNTFNSQLQLMKNNALDFAIVLGTQLLPILTRLLPKIGNAISAAANWIGRNKELTSFILKVVGALGLFLLAVAPIALVIGGLADLVGFYSGLQLILAARTVAATTAIEAQAAAYAEDAAAAYEAAYATKTVASTSFLGLIGQLTGVAGLAYVIDMNWKSWGDSVTTILGPFGELLNIIEQIKNSQSKFNLDSSQGGVAGASKGFVDLMAGVTNGMTNFYTSPLRGVAKQFGYNIPEAGSHDAKPALSNMAIQSSMMQTNTTQNNLSIDLNDPYGLVKKTQSSGPVSIPVKVTSTTGNK